MESSRVVGFLDSITANIATDALKRLAQPLSDQLVVTIAIRRTASEFEFADVSRCLSALLDEIPGILERGDSETLVGFAHRYISIAGLAGNVVDESSALDIVTRFFTHLDDKELTLAEHDRRERERLDALQTHIDTRFDEIQGLVAGSRGAMASLQPLVPETKVEEDLAAVSALIDAGMYVTADEKLARLDQSDLADDLRFRVATMSGICAYHRDDKAIALSAFASARALRPDSAAAASNLAAVYLATSELDKAFAEADAAWRLDSTCIANYITALYLMGDLARLDALVLLQRESLSDGNALLALARVYLSMERFDEAEKYAEKAVELHGDADAKEVLALTLLARGGFSRHTC